ncbi:hypothetical protein [Kaistia sp. MMO-174]|uniref:hypothetical protein n=1 Tax=Kaistia sp. MMO-174 TaxID=3081256 RepID=UPI0030198181
MTDDGFIEILPAAETRAKEAPVTMAATEWGRQHARYLSITFHIDRMEDDARKVLDGPRFNVAFNPHMHCLRIRAADGMGKFETRKAPRGTAVTLRFPLPDGVAFHTKRVPVEADIGLSRRELLIDLPQAFRPAKPVAVASGDAFEIRREIADRQAGNQTSALMGDPPPGRSALDQKKVGK